MCTVSWFKSPNGYELFFNRDEQKCRPPALCPTIIDKEGCSIACPIDTQAGGTWIATNQYGITACLLNLYSKIDYSLSTTTDYISRGNIVLAIADSHSLEEVYSRISKLELSQYRTFRLLCFDSDANTTLFSWNGSAMAHEQNVSSPKSSSSVDTEKVVSARKSLYKKLELSKAATRSELIKFHKNHSNDLTQSVCMHDTHRQTVSLTHVIVGQNRTKVDYYNGSPCNAADPASIDLSRTK